MNMLFIYIGLGVLALLLLFVFISYVKTSPQIAYVISGLSKKPKMLIGTGGFRIPFFQKLDRIYLGQVTVDVKTTTPVPTSDFIDVMIDAVAKVRVKPTTEGIQLAAANFLNMGPDQISHQVQDVLQGNMREIAGTLDLKSLNTDRDGFSNQLQEKASKDMDALGIEILACNIQNITDKQGLIQALGADNVYKIKKDASINKANAERDIAIAEAEAQKLANDARVLSETEIAVKNNELAIKQADLKKESDTKQAEADAAYQIQEQEQSKIIKVKTVEAVSAEAIIRAERQKEINEKQVQAEIKRTEMLQEQKSLEVTIMQKHLEAEVNKKADAEKYQKEVNAAAELEQRKRQAEAEAYEAEQKARAIRAEAEARKFAMEQEALGIKAQGEAEAYAIQKKGEAEAEAMDKKAEAYKKYTGAAVLEMVVNVLPEVAKSVAEPMSAIDSVNIYGGDANGVTGMSANVPVAIKQVFDTVSKTTGVDMTKILESHTIDAQVQKNINFDGEIKK